MLVLDQELVIFVYFVLYVWQRSLNLLLLAIISLYLQGVLLDILLLQCFDQLFADLNNI